MASVVGGPTRHDVVRSGEPAHLLADGCTDRVMAPSGIGPPIARPVSDNGNSTVCVREALGVPGVDARSPAWCDRGDVRDLGAAAAGELASFDGVNSGRRGGVPRRGGLAVRGRDGAMTAA